MSVRDQINQNRGAIQQKLQAIYAKHGITLSNVSNQGASLRFEKGADALFEAAVEEAEYLATLAGGAVAEEYESGESVEEEQEEQDESDLPPPPPGAKAGKWSGSWSPRTFTGTFTEE